MSARRRAEERASAVADRLDEIVEQIDEISFDLLRESAADGESARPDIDRVLMRARRAVGRAADLLRGDAGSAGSDDD
jgi:hypothetical protein